MDTNRTHKKNNKRLSKDGLKALKQLEGVYLNSYLDSANVWTIGVGHTGTLDGEPLRAGMRITEQKALDILKEEIKQFEDSVNRLVNVELTQNEFDSLVIFAFNIGSHGFKKSSMLNLLNKNIVDDSFFYAWRLWTKVTLKRKKVFIKGLLNRRNAEIKIWGGDYNV